MAAANKNRVSVANHFDVVVLGPDLAGILTASLLARRGLRVLYVEPPLDILHESATNSNESTWHSLPPLPLRLSSAAAPAVGRVVAELNLVQIMRRLTMPVQPPLRLWLGEVELAESASPQEWSKHPALLEHSALVAELQSKLRAAVRSISPLFGHELSVHPTGFWERRDLIRREKRLAAAAELLTQAPAAVRAAFAFPACFTGNLVDADKSIGAVARSHETWHAGLHLFRGGTQGMRTLLLERLRTHGGEVATGHLAKIEIKRGRARRVSLAQQPDPIGADFVVSALPMDLMAQKIDIDSPLREPLPISRTIGARVSRIYQVHSSHSPLHIGVVADPSAPLGDINATLLTLEPAPGGRSAHLTAECLATNDALDRPDELSRRLDQLVHQRFPEATPIGHVPIEERPNAPLLGVVPLRLPAQLSLGIAGVGFSTSIKNLLIVGQETLPGLGFEGVAIAARAAARLISDSTSQNDYLKDAYLTGGPQTITPSRQK